MNATGFASTSFWDDPTHWPDDSWPTEVGQSVEGTVTGLAVRLSRYGKPTLCLELNGDGRERWANRALWRALGAERVEPGMRIRVTRLQARSVDPAAPTTGPMWRVERLAATTPQPTPAATTGPQWW